MDWSVLNYVVRRFFANEISLRSYNEFVRGNPTDVLVSGPNSAVFHYTNPRSVIIWLTLAPLSRL